MRDRKSRSTGAGGPCAWATAARTSPAARDVSVRNTALAYRQCGSLVCGPLVADLEAPPYSAEGRLVVRRLGSRGHPYQEQHVAVAQVGCGHRDALLPRRLRHIGEEGREARAA